MMNVPVDDGDSLEISLFFQIFRRDRHCVEVTEAQRFLRRMMARWTNQSETVS